MYIMYSKINMDLMEERLAVDYDVDSILNSKSDPCNIYILNAFGGSISETW
jgi:hypothetical protein